MSTAAALIIGDEILTGKIRDENTLTLATVMFEQGVDLARIIVVPDDVDQIVRDVRELSSKFDHVFTSGGIGPTHDDKTYESIAKAFGRKLTCHAEALSRLTSHGKTRNPDQEMTPARKRMAFLPDPCEIIWTEGLWVPLVVVENVYILPGIPSFFQMMLQSARHRFVGTPKERILVYTQMSEGHIAESLSNIQEKFHDVAIGSYPQLADPKCQVMVSLEGRDRIRVYLAAEEVERAVKGFR